MPDYSIEVLEHPDDWPVAEWNALLGLQAHPTPFMRAESLAALAAGGAGPEQGWHARFVLLRRDGALHAAAPAWAKRHSWGEYVFDQAWAQAYHQHGLPYYPKLVVAVPFTPVPGSRLLARTEADRQALLHALEQLARAEGHSGVHLLFGDDADQRAAAALGWLRRDGVQFHWTRPAEASALTWPDFLASLQRDKRKKIQQERRRVAEAGVDWRVLEGAQITPSDWRFFHRCYAATYHAHGQHPYLDEACFQRWGRGLPEHWLMFVARREGRDIAASLLAIDRAQGLAWGRYWGALEDLPCLHFEACYYRPLQWCLEQGFQRFEGGAQGEHKMARGLMPVGTGSAHWVAHPGFREAISRFVEREGQGMAAYREELDERSPFKAARSGSAD